jgi:formate hydrogenlyase subunit 6/NADH:ubiquinone oxidoreductase subunit I
MSYSITELCTGCGACVKLCPVDAVSGEKKERHVIDPGLCIECGACGRGCPKEAVADDKGTPVAKMKKSAWPRPVIRFDLCAACENCVGACPAGALAMAREDLPLTKNKAVLAQPGKCVSCGWCVTNCLFDAITLEAA